MNSIMIDLETMGDRSRSVICSIAAVPFDLSTGKTGVEFFGVIDIQSCLDAGLEVTAGTIRWWMAQEPLSRQHLNNCPPYELSAILKAFERYLKGFGERVELWGNGARFDLGILADAYHACGLPVPWSHKAERDVRTLVSLRPQVKAETEFVGIRHFPVDDCIHQIRYCCKIWHSLNQEEYVG